MFKTNRLPLRYINIHEFTNKKEKLMKTRTLLLASVLAFSVSLTASAQVFKTRTGKPAGKTATIVPKTIQTHKAPSLENATITLNVPTDLWGDGTGYQMILDAEAQLYDLISDGLATWDDLYNKEIKIPTNADFAGDNIVFEDSYTIEVAPGSYDIIITNPDPASGRVYIASDNGNVGGKIDNIKFEAGVSYEFRISSVDVGGGLDDATNLYIDGELVEFDEPKNVEAAEVGTNSAQISWESNAGEYNLRYRPFVELPEPVYSCDFEDEDAVAAWNVIDADGDTYAWELNKSDVDGSYAYSLSYDNATYSPLTPDNWLISPEVDLGGTLTLKAAGLDEDYASEVFAVYVNTGDPTDVEAYEKIADDITVTGNWETYSFDLSAYEGQKGHVAIRHYNVTDQFALGIDDIAIYNEAIPEIPEWTVVDGITENTYTIEGLESGTEYEVQVQGVPAGIASEWTESVRFTTEDAPTGISKVEDTKATAGQWYTINGVKLAGKPTQKGVYINNGRKAVVK